VNDGEALEQLGLTPEDLERLNELGDGFTTTETFRIKALELAVKARTPNANGDEIVTMAKTFLTFLTGKPEDE
jgi:hypothetical protein